MSEAAARSKGAALLGLSKVMRGPVGQIAGMAARLSDTRLSSEQKSYLDQLQQASDWLIDLNEALLDYARLGAGDVELADAEFLLIEEAEAAISLLEPRARDKGLTLMFAPAGDVPLKVSGDAGRFRQLLRILLKNAVKFTEKGAVVLRAEQAGDRIRFEVEDSGIGIPAGRIGTLFQEFGRADDAGPSAGFGLGLPSARSIATLMGGTLGMESEEGRGSVFWFELPLAAIGDQRFSDKCRDARPPKRAVLIAAPDLAGKAMRQLLEGASIQVVETESATQADLILVHASPSDIEDASPLPGAEGWTWVAYGPGADAWQGQATAILQGAVMPATLMRAIARAAGRAAAPEPSDAEGAEPAGSSKMRVLVAEADAQKSEATGAMLARMGVETDSAGNGHDAVELCRSGSYDLVLLHLDTPALDGVSTAWRIRNLDGPAGRVAIIALAPSGALKERQAALAAGVDDVIAAPVGAEELRQGIAGLRKAGKAVPAIVTETPKEAAPAPESAVAEAIRPDTPKMAELHPVDGPIDPDRLRQLAGALGAAAVGEMLAAFWADAAMLTTSVQAALMAGDIEMAASTLAELEHAAGKLGIIGCVDACQRLGVAIRAGQGAPPELLAALLNSLPESQRALASIARKSIRASA